MNSNSQIVIYQTEDGETKLDVRLEGETVWLTQKGMGELEESATCKEFLQVRQS